MVQVGVDAQRGAAAGGDRGLDDHRLAWLVGPDDHEGIEEPVGLARSGRGAPGARLVRFGHGVLPWG